MLSENKNSDAKLNPDKPALPYQDYLAGTRQVLEASQQETESYYTEVAGQEFIVHRGVFSPKYFHDTEEFALHLPVQDGEEMLEIGPGTGAIAITAVYNGAKKVTAIDINPRAVENTQDNINLHNLNDKVEVRQGDLYEALKNGEKFDTIFWNTPFGFVEDENLTDLEKSVYDSGYKSTQHFFQEAGLYLKPDGRLLIGFSSTLGRLDLLEKFAADNGFDLKLIYEVESEEVHPVKFEIFEARLKIKM